MNGLTALRGLELLDLARDATLVVTGGAGLLASYVIPLAKLRGLRVLADAAPADDGARARLRRRRRPAAGRRPVARRSRGVPGGVDAVFDTAVLGRGVLPAIRPGGGLAFVRTWDGDDVEDGIEIHRVLVREVLERTDWLRELSDLAARGVLALRVASTFPPERGRGRASADGGRRPARPRRHRLRLERTRTRMSLVVRA